MSNKFFNVVHRGGNFLREFRTGFTQGHTLFHQGRRYMNGFASNVHKFQNIAENASRIPLINDTIRLILDDPVYAEIIAQIDIANDLYQDVDTTLGDVVKLMHGQIIDANDATPMTKTGMSMNLYPPRPSSIYHQPIIAPPIPLQQDQGGVDNARPYDEGFRVPVGFIKPPIKDEGRSVS